MGNVKSLRPATHTPQLRQERNLSSQPRPQFPSPVGAAYSAPTELEPLFDLGFYKYAAPDGALVCESQRDSNPSAQGLACDAGLPWETVPTNASTPKALHPVRRYVAATLSELS